jgi:hypothetical protein
MKVITGALMVAVLLAVTAVPTLAGGAPVVTNEVVPISGTSEVPCANGGAGEVVAFSGEMHMLVGQVPNEDGGITLIWNQNAMGITGVGLTTGTQYRVAGMHHGTQTVQASGAGTISTIDNMLFVAAGPGNTLRAHVVEQVRIEPDGTTVILVSIADVTCN